MIAILHGYLLEGSGSNLWTRAVVRSLCRQGETVHLMCQENHLAPYDFIAEGHRYNPDGSVDLIIDREVPYPGRCILHKPVLGDTLPVYVRDQYDEFENVVPMVELPDSAIEAYIERNVRVLQRVIEERGITALHANHAVLMSVVAQRVSAGLDVPYAIMPHGSALEYAVKPDPRFHQYASEAFRGAERIFVIGREMRERVLGIFPELPGIESAMRDLNLGVDTSLFEPVERPERPRKMQELARALRDVPRGKTPDLSRGLELALREIMHAPAESGGSGGRLARTPSDALHAAMAESGSYDQKRPDAGLEGKLERVDWRSDPVLLFVGRLIANKGIQSVIAAMPLVLERHPKARLVVVGHGPLREPLEALLWALRHGERELALRLIAEARSFEGGPSEPVPELDGFFENLEERGRFDHYFEAARHKLDGERVIFTGYLTHRHLRYLFPCADVAVFPSVVREAGPLVFLEALASGCLPLGTDFGGMAASIDAAAEGLPSEVSKAMRLRPEPEHLVHDIVAGASAALARPGEFSGALREVAERKYDWRSVAALLLRELEGM